MTRSGGSYNAGKVAGWRVGFGAAEGGDALWLLAITARQDVTYFTDRTRSFVSYEYVSFSAKSRSPHPCTPPEARVLNVGPLLLIRLSVAIRILGRENGDQSLRVLVVE